MAVIRILLILALLSSCKVKKVKDISKVDSVAHVARNEVRNEISVLLDTSQIVTENKTYIEVLNDSGKVVQRIFSYEIKHEKKAIKKQNETLTETNEVASVKVSNVSKKKDKTSMSYWGAVIVLVAVVWIWFSLRK